MAKELVCFKQRCANNAKRHISCPLFWFNKSGCVCRSILSRSTTRRLKEKEIPFYCSVPESNNEFKCLLVIHSSRIFSPFYRAKKVALIKHNHNTLWSCVMDTCEFLASLLATNPLFVKLLNIVAVSNGPPVLHFFLNMTSPI